MNPAGLIRRRSDVPTAEFGDELAVMDLRSGSYLSFNATAAAVWKLLEQPRSFDDLCAGLQERYDVAAQQCRSEVRDLIGELERLGVVEHVDD